MRSSSSILLLPVVSFLLGCATVAPAPAHHHSAITKATQLKSGLHFSVRTRPCTIQVGESQWIEVTVHVDHKEPLARIGGFEAAVVEDGNILFSCPMERSTGHMDRDGDKRGEQFLTTTGRFIIDKRFADKCQVLLRTDHPVDPHKWSIMLESYLPK